MAISAAQCYTHNTVPHSHIRRGPAMNANISRADTLMSRLLLISRPSQPAPESNPAAKTSRAQNALTASLLFSGLRCILQYALLPFLLPVIGLAADAAIPILLLINLLAITSIFLSLRRFWTISYKHRWPYLCVAITALILLTAFTAHDIITLRQP